MAKERRPPRDFTVGLSFLRSLGRIVPLLFPSIEYAALFTVLTLGFAIAKEFTNYYSGASIGNFTSALMSLDEPKFWGAIGYSSSLYIAHCLAIAVVSLSSWCLFLAFRRNVVHALHQRYFAHGFYYRINCVDNEGIDNPDQRITSDVEKASQLLATKILPTLLLSPFVIAYYIRDTVNKAGWMGVGFIVLYFVLGLAVNRLVVAPLSKWAARVERAEGDFRYKHVSVRDHAEEIAFSEGAEFERTEAARFFSLLLLRQKSFVLWRFPIELFQNFFDYYGAVLSYIIMVIPVFLWHEYDKMDIATRSYAISNNAFVFMTLINKFTSLTDIALSVGEFSGYLQRITELIDAADAAALPEITTSDSDFIGSDASEPLVVAKGLTYGPPTAEEEDEEPPLVNGISFSLAPGSSLLISGASGCGKTSLFRCMARLWPSWKGTLRLPPSGVVFAPQRPYLPVGGLSIGQQLLYPSDWPEEKDAVWLQGEDLLCRMTSLLESLGLQRLLLLSGGSLVAPVHFEWHDVLSPGEQQRIVLARLLLRRPQLALLDECTSSLSESAERDAYERIREAGISYISTGHRSTLLSFHSHILRIDDTEREPSDQLKF